MASGGPYLQSLAQARQVQWGKTWQWDSRFPDAPAPFDRWFPATEARRGISELQTHSFVGFGDTFDIPFASGIRDFTCTFLDDDQGTLMHWFDQWMELYIQKRGESTQRLSKIVRRCDLAQLDGTGNPVRQWYLQVYPYGSLSYVGNSESRFASYMISFRIAGIVNPED